MWWKDMTSTVAFFATVQQEGGHEVERDIEFFNPCANYQIMIA